MSCEAAAPAEPGPIMGPSRNPMVWIYGEAAQGLTCAGCRFLHRNRNTYCALRPRFVRDHSPALPACGRFAIMTAADARRRLEQRR